MSFDLKATLGCIIQVVYVNVEVCVWNLLGDKMFGSGLRSPSALLGTRVLAKLILY